MLHPHGEDGVTNLTYFNILAKEVADELDKGENQDEVQKDTAEHLPSVRAQIDALSTAHTIVDTHSMLLKKVSKALLKSQEPNNIE